MFIILDVHIIIVRNELTTNVYRYRKQPIYVDHMRVSTIFRTA